MSENGSPRVVVIGGGVAGLMAGTYTARAGFDTIVVSKGESILRRNAHLENVPGFPAGVDARLFVDLLEQQAERNGCLLEDGIVTAVEQAGERFRITVEHGDVGDDSVLSANYAVVASWSDVSYLEALDSVGLIKRGSKHYIEIDDDGRTDLDGLYATGRIAGKPHQTVVCAGHGAEVALTLIHDSEIPFYQDWVAPEGYFSERGRDVPPGCEEIDDAERLRRERESMELMADAFEDHYPGAPTMHPSVVEKRNKE